MCIQFQRDRIVINALNYSITDIVYYETYCTGPELYIALIHMSTLVKLLKWLYVKKAELATTKESKIQNGIIIYKRDSLLIS